MLEPLAKLKATVAAKTAFAMSNVAMERQVQGPEAGFPDFSRRSPDFRQLWARIRPDSPVSGHAPPAPGVQMPEKMLERGDHSMWRCNWSIAKARTPKMMCAKTFACPLTRTWWLNSAKRAQSGSPASAVRSSPHSTRCQKPRILYGLLVKMAHLEI